MRGRAFDEQAATVERHRIQLAAGAELIDQPPTPAAAGNRRRAGLNLQLLVGMGKQLRWQIAPGIGIRLADRLQQRATVQHHRQLAAGIQRIEFRHAVVKGKILAHRVGGAAQHRIAGCQQRFCTLAERQPAAAAHFLVFVVMRAIQWHQHVIAIVTAIQINADQRPVIADGSMCCTRPDAKAGQSTQQAEACTLSQPTAARGVDCLLAHDALLHWWTANSALIAVRYSAVRARSRLSVMLCRAS